MSSKVRAKQMPEMEKELVTCKDRLAFLVDFTSFTPREMRMNSEIFKWNARMDRVFEDHERIIDVKQGQYQDGLRVSNSRVKLQVFVHYEIDVREVECQKYYSPIFYGFFMVSKNCKYSKCFFFYVITKYIV